MKTKLNKLYKIVKKQLMHTKSINYKYTTNSNGFKTIVDYTNFFESNVKMKKNTWMVESNEGQGLSLGIDRMLTILFNDEMTQPLIYVVYKNMANFKWVNEKYPAVLFIKKGSREYLSLLTNSENILTDGILPSIFIRKIEQKVYNTLELFNSFQEGNTISIDEKKGQNTLLQSSHLLGLTNKVAYDVIKRLGVSNIFEGELCNHFFSVSDKATNEVPIGLVYLNSEIWLNHISVLLTILDTYTNRKKDPIMPLFVVTAGDYKRLKKDLRISQYIIAMNQDMSYLNSRIHLIIYDRSTIDNGVISEKFHVTKAKKNNEAVCLTKFKWEKMIKTKKNILMYCGGFLNNGITTSAINLSQNIDTSKYNLIVIDKYSEDPRYLDNLAKLDENTTILYRTGQINVTKREYYAHEFIISRRGMRRFLQVLNPNKIYQREMRRIIGETRVDVGVDFSGYVPFWSAMIAFSNFPRKVIYQHNDLYAETKKISMGKSKHKYVLPRVFSLYKYFHAIISVSEQTKILNLNNLAKYTKPTQAFSVNNILNLSTLYEKSKLEKDEMITTEDGTFIMDLCINNVNSVEMTFNPFPDTKSFNFITIGRLSPEKCHEKLFLSFKKVLSKYPEKNIHLYVLGEGELKENLEKFIINNGLSETIHLLGQVGNPYKYLSVADCFVLSSDHEGQPMVLLEALALNKKIIATDIVGNRGVLEGTYGKLVPNNIGGLSLSMIEALNDTEDNMQNYDIKVYNKQALESFYAIVCGV